MQPLRSSHITRTVRISVAFSIVAVVTLGALLYFKRSAIPDMDLGEWGAFLAGAAGVFAFILISAGFWLQKSALEQQEHALGRLALALESQSAALMATHEPALESSTLLVADEERLSEGQQVDRIELTLINTGGDARDLRVSVCGMETMGPLHRTHSDDSKVQRHPSLTQGNPPWISSWFHYHDGGDLPDSRPRGFLIALYRDMYGIEHKLKFEVHWHRSPFTEPPFLPTKYGFLLRVSNSSERVGVPANASM